MGTVTVGGEAVTVEPVTALKMFIGGDLLSQVSEATPAALLALADFASDYRQRNTLYITPEMARLPDYQRAVSVDESGTVEYEAIFTEADFESAGGRIAFPREPEAWEQYAVAFGVYWKAAKQPIFDLVTLLLVPNDQLADAHRSGSHAEYLRGEQARLLYSLKLSELKTLVPELITHLTDEAGASSPGEALAGAANFAGLTSNPSPSPTNAPASSESSPPAPDGAATQFFTEPLTEKSTP